MARRQFTEHEDLFIAMAIAVPLGVLLEYFLIRGLMWLLPHLLESL